jgi:Ger(x)C family germination protein
MRQEGGFGTPIESIAVLVGMFQKSKDFIRFSLPGAPQITISFFRTMINEETLHRDVLPHIPAHVSSLVDVQIALPIEAMELTTNIEQISSKVLNGYAMMEDGSDTCLIIAICNKEGRQIATPEIEYNVVGPQEAFVELIDINLNMLRRRLPTPYLCVEELEIGTLSHTRVAVVFIDGIANEDNIKHVRDKLKNIEIDHIQDSSYVIRMIEDNPNSLFPQAINTERPDRVAGVLAEGKIALFVNGSPFAITLPTTIVEFFSTSEDYNLPWIMASTFRLLRLFSVLFSMLATIAGIALFYKDRMRDILPAKNMFIFKALIDGFSNGAYSFRFKNQFTVIENINAKTDYKVQNSSVLHINMKVKGKIQEFTEEKNLEVPKLVRQIEKEMEQSAKKEVEQLILRFQEKGVDPLGLGRVYRAKDRNWNEKKWRSDYANLKVKVHVQVKVVQSGVVE